MNKKSDDITLWEAFRNGDEEALGILMERHYRHLYNYATKFTKNKEFIKDSIQDLFLELLNHYKTIGSTEFVRSYLLKSLRRKLYKEGLKLKVFSQVEDWDEDLNFETEFSIESQLIEEESIKESSEKLTRILNKLPKRQKEIIYLRYYQELDHTEIASVMSLNSQAVYNLLYKSLKNLKEYWYSGSELLLTIFLPIVLFLVF